LRFFEPQFSMKRENVKPKLLSYPSLCLLCLLLFLPQKAAAAEVVALGASSVQGVGVSAGEAWPEVLQGLLRARGFNVTVKNAGIGGQTSADILNRAEYAVDSDTKVVILLIGRNDFTKGGNKKTRAANIQEIVKRLRAKGVTVIPAGHLYLGLSKQNHIAVDGRHPNAAGHRVIANGLVPQVMAALRR
jgi:acyl-CoA thioesterase-1